MAAPAVGLSAAGWPRRAPWLPAGGAGGRGPGVGAPERRGPAERPAEARAVPPRRGPLDLPELRLDRRGGGEGSYRTFRAGLPAWLPRLPRRRAAPRRAARRAGAGSCRAGGDWRPAGPSTWPRAAGAGAGGAAVFCDVSLSPRGCGALDLAAGAEVCAGAAGVREPVRARPAARPHGIERPELRLEEPPPGPGPPPEVCGCRSATPPGRRISAGWGHSGRPGPPAGRVGDGPSPRARGGWSARLGVRARCGFWAMVGLSASELSPVRRVCHAVGQGMTVPAARQTVPDGA